MAFKNVGTMDLGTHTAQGASAAAGGNAGRFCPWMRQALLLVRLS